jgi:glutamate synthase (ferredoxin)
MIERHLEYTGSSLARRVLSDWEGLRPRFVKLMPRDYQRMLQAFQEVEGQGLTGDEGIMAAFELNRDALARVGGN